MMRLGNRFLTLKKLTTKVPLLRHMWLMMPPSTLHTVRGPHVYGCSVTTQPL